MSIDSIYYSAAASLSLSRRAMRFARERMYELFISEFTPTRSTSILDLGVSDEENGEANMLEKLYPYPERVTCAGLGDGHSVISSYPGIEYVRVLAQKPLPFSDNSFDVICSNAVLEHVGGVESRRFFLLEALRVARMAFITVPNRWFPVEPHTGVPVVHFCPPLFRLLLRRTRLAHWAEPQNLEFLDSRLLVHEWPSRQRSIKVVHTGIRLGPFSSNIAVIVK